MTFSIVISGIPLSISANFSETKKFFRFFVSESYSAPNLISVPLKLFEELKGDSHQSALTAADEFFLLHLSVSNALLPFDRCVFHGTAILWRDKAWLFSAPSGTGKTTQYRQWRRLYRSEIRIINGDKPVLQLCDDGTIMVHPSPWMGKERLGCMLKAPLGGIIYLEQGKENTIELMDTQDAAVPIYRQFLFLPETEEAIRQVCRLEDRILRGVPVWKLVNKGDAQSAELTHDTLVKWLETHDV